jgi:hypothetical protein
LTSSAANEVQSPLSVARMLLQWTNPVFDRSHTEVPKSLADAKSNPSTRFLFFSLCSRNIIIAGRTMIAAWP